MISGRSEHDKSAERAVSVDPLSKALTLALAVFKEPPKSMEPLRGGETNNSFKAIYDHGTYVMKVFSAQSNELAIRREAEIAAAKQAEALGMGPPVIHADSHFLMTRFMSESLERERGKSPVALWQDFSPCLEAFHSSGLVLPLFNPLTNAELMIEIASQSGTKLPAGLCRLLGDAHRISDVYKETVLCCCHNDLNVSNILFTEHGSMFIDWEYCGANTPLYDIAKYCNHHFIAREDAQRILDTYSLDLGANAPERLAAQRVLAGVWSIGWLLLRSSRDVSLSDYIPLRLRQAQELVTDLTH